MRANDTSQSPMRQRHNPPTQKCTTTPIRTPNVQEERAFPQAARKSAPSPRRQALHACIMKKVEFPCSNRAHERVDCAGGG
eukprot:1390325-Prymnesium_polylepis.2